MIQVFSLRHQTPQGESFALPETLLLIMPSMVFKYCINEIHDN